MIHSCMVAPCGATLIRTDTISNWSFAATAHHKNVVPFCYQHLYCFPHHGQLKLNFCYLCLRSQYTSLCCGMDVLVCLLLTDLRWHHVMLDITTYIIRGCAKGMHIIIFVVVVLWRNNGYVARVKNVALHNQLAPDWHSKIIQVVWYSLQRGKQHIFQNGLCYIFRNSAQIWKLFLMLPPKNPKILTLPYLIIVCDLCQRHSIDQNK